MGCECVALVANGSGFNLLVTRVIADLSEDNGGRNQSQRR